MRNFKPPETDQEQNQKTINAAIPVQIFARMDDWIKDRVREENEAIKDAMFAIDDSTAVVWAMDTPWGQSYPAIGGLCAFAL